MEEVQIESTDHIPIHHQLPWPIFHLLETQDVLLSIKTISIEEIY